MTFGEQLEKLRKEKHMTQEEMGEKFGICASTLSNYERGVHQPDLEFIDKVADYFHVSIDYMFGRTSFCSPIDQLNVLLSDSFTVGDLLNIVLDYDHPHLELLLSYLDYLSSRHALVITEKPSDKNKA
ncbi:MAG: helix-turn-helix domain-containing protein [Lachnospiraceae bacterium]|nr:helix-turn-helix domain-containing protein [Lachnospiraceae bacterium]